MAFIYLRKKFFNGNDDDYDDDDDHDDNHDEEFFVEWLANCLKTSSFTISRDCCKWFASSISNL